MGTAVAVSTGLCLQAGPAQADALPDNHPTATDTVNGESGATPTGQSKWS